MQKKLIALAVAGLMAAPLVAQAGSAEVYGKVRVSVGVVGNDEADDNREDSKLNVASHNSRFGVKGSEDLQDGLKAIYQFETEVDFDDDNSDQKLFDSMRDTYVGLKGDFGTVKFGRINSPYKQATGKLDVWKDTHSDYNGIFKGHDDRFDNTIAYFSPDMNGLVLEAAYITDTADDDLVDTTDSTDIGGTTLEQSGISVAGKYNNGPLFASLAYQVLSESGAQDGTSYDDYTGTKLSLGYKVSKTALGFVYEIDDMGGSEEDQGRMYFSVNQPVGNDMAVKFAYAMADDRGDAEDTGVTQFSLGLTKKMGDTAELYALYTQLENDDNAKFNLYESKVAGTSKGEGASAIVVGLNLKFSSM